MWNGSGGMQALDEGKEPRPSLAVEPRVSSVRGCGAPVEPGEDPVPSVRGCGAGKDPRASMSGRWSRDLPIEGLQGSGVARTARRGFGSRCLRRGRGRGEVVERGLGVSVCRAVSGDSTVPGLCPCGSQPSSSRG